MKKLFLFILILFLSFNLFAQRRIIDDAGLLTAAEINELERRADEIASAYNFDLIIVTKTGIGGEDINIYADNFYDDNQYGMGEHRDGCLFLFVTNAAYSDTGRSGERDYSFCTTGRAIDMLDKNDYAFNKLESDVLYHISRNDIAQAFRAFLNVLEEFLILEAKGGTYNFFHVWHLAITAVIWVLAILIGIFFINTWKKQMDLFIPPKEANLYAVSQSLAFTQSKDTFLYSNVSKIRRASESSGSSLGGGGLRTSSSGRIHGGRSGKI